MSPATVTPTKHSFTNNNITTVESKKNADDRLLFTTVLTTQDFQQKCTNILNVLKGDDVRAKARVVIEVKDIVRGLSAVEGFLLDIVKLHGKTTQCFDFTSRVKKETNAEIKCVQPFFHKKRERHQRIGDLLW